MHRRVTAIPAFYESLFRLDVSEATVRAGTALLFRAAARPASSDLMPALGNGIRVLKSQSYGGFAAIRLFYWMDDEDVLLLDIERYDEAIEEF